MEEAAQAQNPLDNLRKSLHFYSMRYKTLVDRTTPYSTQRWAVFSCLVLVFLLRVFISQGWYLITYALGIYLLNIFLAFLTPKFVPALEMENLVGNEGDMEEEGKDGPSLPTGHNDEFRPFIRRLPEFKFWYNAVRAVMFALLCTLTDATDVPVFWPILLVYFILLTILTLRRQIRHMVKYKYVPFDLGKAKYQK